MIEIFSFAKKYCSIDFFFKKISFASKLSSIKNYAFVSLQRIKNVQKLNEIENEIRKQSKFEKFQFFSTKTKFHHLTRHDSFVSFNVINFGSHVFLITENNIRMLRFFKNIFKNLKKYVSNKTKKMIFAETSKLFR